MPDCELHILMPEEDDGTVTRLTAFVVAPGLASEAVASLLTQLELDGLVAALPGGKYQRLR